MIPFSDVVQKQSQSSQVHTWHAKQTLIGLDISRYIRQLFTLFDSVQKLPFIISKQIQSTVQENASVVSVLFTFEHSLISHFATHNQQNHKLQGRYPTSFTKIFH